MYIKKDLLDYYANKWYNKPYDELSEKEQELIRLYIEESLL